jgi:L-asparaginase II
VEESRHRVDVVVADAEGRLLAWAGEPSLRLFGRSSLKPVQGAVSLRASGVTPGSVPDELVAIACSSHNGEPVHVRTVRRLLRGAGLDVDALGTPPAYPIDIGSVVTSRMPAPLWHNCSGKHAGMLAGCVGSGWPTATYRARTHPLQRRIGSAVEAATGGPVTAIGVDGCGAPVHETTLMGMATMYARLGSPARFDDLAPWVERCVAAMRARPYLVGGRDRADTDVMTEIPGLVAKEGAEALFCVGVRDAGLGVAAKVADGGERAAAPVVLEVLRQLGLLGPRQRSRLRSWAEPRVRGGGRAVGALVAEVPLAGRRGLAPNGRTRGTAASP